MYRKLFSSALLIAAFSLVFGATDAEARGYRGGYRNRGGMWNSNYGYGYYGNYGSGNFGYGSYRRHRMAGGVASDGCSSQPANCCGQPVAVSTVSSSPVAPPPAMQRAPTPAAAN